MLKGNRINRLYFAALQCALLVFFATSWKAVAQSSLSSTDLSRSTSFTVIPTNGVSVLLAGPLVLGKSNTGFDLKIVRGSVGDNYVCSARQVIGIDLVDRAGKTLKRTAPQSISSFEWANEVPGLKLSRQLPISGEDYKTYLEDFYYPVPHGHFNAVGSILTQIGRANGTCDTTIMIRSQPIEINL